MFLADIFKIRTKKLINLAQTSSAEGLVAFEVDPGLRFSIVCFDSFNRLILKIMMGKE